MIYKYTTSKDIISKVVTDLDLQEETHRISDMIEWIGEAVEKIGGFPFYDVKITGKEGVPLLTVTNYQAKLPDDLHKIIGVAYSTSSTGTFIPLRYGTGTFDFRSDSTASSDSDFIAADTDLIQLAMELYDLSYEDAVSLINTDSITRDKLTSLLRSESVFDSTPKATGYTSDYTYVLNSNYIKLNKRTGVLLMAYQAVPRDPEGFPLIPDDQGWREAVYWYIVTKMWYPLWVSGKLRDRVYYDARRSWNFYVKQAYSNAMMPNADQLESLKNKWLKLVPEIKDEFDTFFSASGQMQNVYNWTK